MEKLHNDGAQEDGVPANDTQYEGKLFVAESLNDRGEALIDMEKWEGGLDIEDVVAGATQALEQFNLNKSTRGLADMHSKLVALAWHVLRKNAKKPVNPTGTVNKLLEFVKKGVQEKMKGSALKFSNEDIFKHLGDSRAKGILADINYLSYQENAPEGAARRHYSNAMLDNAYGIDYVTTILRKNVVGGRALYVDLVQVKANGETVDETERDAIVKKQMDFLRHYMFAFESRKVKEAAPGELQKLIDGFGFEKGTHVREAWDMAHSDPDEHSALSWWRESLEEFKADIMSDPLFATASNAAKWAYVSGIGERVHLEDDPDFASNFGTIFKEWQRVWLESINVKKVRGLEAPTEVHYRLVIHMANGEREIYAVNTDRAQAA